MSDMGRKDMSDKIGEKITPDSQKSTMQQTKETMTGMGDKAARDMQGDSQKSGMQSGMDKMSREKDFHSSSGMTGTKDDRSMMDKAKDAVGMGDKHH